MSFVFIPSRDMRSLGGASLDTLRYFPLVDSEKTLNGPYLPWNEIFSLQIFSRLAPLHVRSYEPIRHVYRALGAGFQGRRVPLLLRVLGLQSSLTPQYDFSLEYPLHAV